MCRIASVTMKVRAIILIISVAAVAGLFTGCASSPVPPQVVATAAPAPAPAGEEAVVEVSASPARDDVVIFALGFIGTPYRYGGASPQKGFDCSGLVRYVFNHWGLELPRTTHEIAAALPDTPAGNREPGDLVFFQTTRQRYSHVGIYLGDEQFVHAPSARSGRVMISRMDNPYWRTRFTGARDPWGHRRE